VRVWPLLFSIGCQPAVSLPPDRVPDRTTTPAPTVEDSASELVYQSGHLVHMRRLPSMDIPGSDRLVGFFAEDLQALPFPAPCVADAALCIDELPLAVDTWLTPEEAAFNPSASRIVWVGDRIYLGDLPVDFVPDADADLGWYARDADSLPDADAIDVSLSGEWGQVGVEALLPLAAPLELLSPLSSERFDLATQSEVPLVWVPGNGELFLSINGPRDFRRIYRLEDDGAFTFDGTALGSLLLGDEVTFELLRVQTQTHVEDGHALTAQGISTQGFTGAVSRPRTCLEHLEADPTAVSGVYTIQPGLAPAVDVFCDMTTDQGGWTLVASSAELAIDDIAGPWQATLTTLNPVTGATAIWDGLRSVIATNSDVRFACKLDPLDSDMTVDLSFYDTVWYREFTTGTDADSCFSEQEGAGYDQPAAARQNNLTGDTRALGEDWETAGYLEGEDSCADTDDFTVDFSDRGMDGNQSDGTDWGEDDGSLKCGVEGLRGGAWFLFVREP
jgi:hypothetical protein